VQPADWAVLDVGARGAQVLRVLVRRVAIEVGREILDGRVATDREELVVDAGGVEPSRLLLQLEDGDVVGDGDDVDGSVRRLDDEDAHVELPLAATRRSRAAGGAAPCRARSPGKVREASG
jgi:hypothetical protein